MAYYFSPYEIAVLAIQIEEEGQIFYTKVANLMKDPDIRKIFLFLSDQESKHKKAFEDIAAETEKKYPEAEYVIDIRSQIASLVDFINKKSFDYDSVTSDSVNMIEAIDVGIKTEIQSISVYQLIKKTLIETFGQVIDEIIAQEEGHLDMLTQLKKRYQPM